MIYSYCKRCKTESPGDTCAQCGKRSQPAAQRDIWSISVNPLKDTRLWRGAVCTVLGVAALLLLIVFGLELMMHGNARAQALWQGRVPSR